jgi:REP element-mobilizing transposase RayT
MLIARAARDLNFLKHRFDQKCYKKIKIMLFSKINLHLIFSTKNQKDLLKSAEIRRRLWAFTVGVCKRLDSEAAIVGGTENHIHILCAFAYRKTVSLFVKEIKRRTLRWIRTHFIELPQFEWQENFGAFSISPSHLDAVKQYIARQSEHHQTATFENEMRTIWKKYNVKCDESTAWD